MVATRRLMPYAAVLAAALALTACSSGDPKPPQTAGPTSAVTSSSVPTTTATTTSATPTTVEDPVLAKIPKAARAETQKGAEAFAAYFLTTLSGAARTADPTPLIGLTSDECKACRVMIRSIDALQKAGHHHAGDTLRVMSTDLLSLEAPQAVVWVRVVQDAVDILDASGNKVDRTQADKGAFVATMTYHADRWTITNLQTMAS